MKYIEGVVFFNSIDQWYTKEESGAKNNIIRVLSKNEYNIIIWNSVVEIEILNSITGQAFRRDITDVCQIGGLCGHHIVIFTWKQEGKRDEETNKIRKRKSI